jgi:hypothetical protein
MQAPAPLRPCQPAPLVSSALTAYAASPGTAPPSIDEGSGPTGRAKSAAWGGAPRGLRPWRDGRAVLITCKLHLDRVRQQRFEMKLARVTH